MNVKRFTARTSREALALVKQAFGDDAVVMSTRPCPEGVEVVAMASESVMQLERVGAASTAARPVVPAAQAIGRRWPEPEAEHQPGSAPERYRDLQPEPEPATSHAPLSWTAPERPAAVRIAAAARQVVAAAAPSIWAGVTAARERKEPPMDPAPRGLPAWADDGNSARDQPAPAPRALRQASSSASPTPQPSKYSRAPAPQPPAAGTGRPWPRPGQGASESGSTVQSDVKALEMSTLSFQEYVRQRMLKRREAELAAEASAQAARRPSVVSPIEAARKRLVSSHQQALAVDERNLPVLRDEVTLDELAATSARQAAGTEGIDAAAQAPVAADRKAVVHAALRSGAEAAPQRQQVEMMSELRSMRGLIEQRFGALAFMQKLQREPRQAQLAQRLMDAGFSPGLVRRMLDGLPADGDELAWAATVLERNLITAEREAPLEDQGGVFALIGTTGVGKTTSTAKLAAAFAAKHGASNLGLVTLDAYRVGAHEQLRTYGRILGVPVHTAHDRASLEDLLDLLSGKRMVLIDTAGMAQRDNRTRELLDMVSNNAVKRLLVINASAQGETIEDQLAAYAAQSCCGVVLSKLDEAVKLGPALDSMVRHKLKVLAVANGQRVPEDWHRLSANALVQRALRGGGSPSWKLSDNEVNLIFAGMPMTAPVVPTLSARA
jgi:flagellar biosynthesis protein FlhF